MTIIEQIRAEIERRIKIQDDWAGRKVLPGRDLAFAVKEELKQLLSFLDTLETETKEEKKFRQGFILVVDTSSLERTFF